MTTIKTDGGEIHKKIERRANVFFSQRTDYDYLLRI